MRWTLSASALAIAALWSGWAVAQEKTSEADAMHKLETLISPYSQAFSKGDAAAIAQFFTPNAVYIVPSSKQFSGRSAIEQSYSETFRRIGGMRSFESKPDEAHLLSDGTIWAIGHSTLTGEKGTFKTHWAEVAVPENNQYKIRMLSVGADLSAIQHQTAQRPGQ